MMRLELEKQAKAYVHSLADFIIDNRLLHSWFDKPDHIAVKAYDAQGYDYYQDQIARYSKRLSFVKLDDRRLGAALLEKPLKLPMVDEVEWLEIMEPRPERVGRDLIGVEHMEFYFPDFEIIQRVLDHRHVDFELQENPGHSWVNVVINPSGQEVKFNDGRLRDIVARGLEAGEATVVV